MNFDWLNFDLSGEMIVGVVATAILVFAVFAIRGALTSRLSQGEKARDPSRRRLRSVVGNIATVVLILGLVLIWLPQLTTFALSLTAFAVALVIALREFLLCLVGGLYRLLARPFQIGDWVEIDDLHGEVIAENLFSFRLKLFGPWTEDVQPTGRTASIPNSRLLMVPIVNESQRRSAVRVTFDVVLPSPKSVAAVRDVALSAAQMATGQHLDAIKRAIAENGRRLGDIEPPPLEPEVQMLTAPDGKLVLQVALTTTFPAARSARTAVTQAVLTAVS